MDSYTILEKDSWANILICLFPYSKKIKHFLITKHNKINNINSKRLRKCSD